MFLVSRVTWHNNGRTEISAEQVSAELDLAKEWLAYNYPDEGPFVYDSTTDLWRTAPRNVFGSDSFWSISTIEEIRG